jgi:hypothetical protein
MSLSQPRQAPSARMRNALALKGVAISKKGIGWGTWKNSDPDMTNVRDTPSSRPGRHGLSAMAGRSCHLHGSAVLMPEAAKRQSEQPRYQQSQ